MENERRMKDAIRLDHAEGPLSACIDELLSDKAEMTDEETGRFWEAFHQILAIYEMEEECEAETASMQETVMVDPSVILGSKIMSVRLLFLAGMTLNILWMQVLIMKYGNSTMIQLVTWGMITAVSCFVLSWIKPYRIFKRRHAND